MKRIAAMVVAFMMIVSIGLLAFAAEEKKAPEAPKEEKKAPEPAKKEEKKAVEKVMQAKGEVTAVDAKANTLALKTAKKGDITLDVTAETKITSGKEVKSLADVKVGDKVNVKYVSKEGKNISTSIALKAATKK